MRPSIKIFAMLCVCCALGAARAGDTPAHQRTAEEIAAHHFAAAISGDLDVMMSDYADDAVFISQDGVFRGKAAIRERFSHSPIHAKPFDPVPAMTPTEFARTKTMRLHGGSRIVQFVQRHYTPNVAVLMWIRNAGQADEIHAVQSMVIRNGKIAYETEGDYRGRFVAP